MNEIVTKQEPSEVVTVDGDFLAKLAMDANVTAEKLQVMADVAIKLREAQRQWDREDEAKQARLVALAAKAAMQAELPVFEKDIPNPHTKSKFTDFADIWEKCCPIWSRHGFSVSFDVLPTANENIRLKCMLMHSAGYVEEYFSPETPPDTKGPQGNVNKTVPQGQQASITYLQRGLLCRAVGVAMKREDDDGSSGRRDDERGPVSQGPAKPKPEVAAWTSQWLTNAKKTLDDNIKDKDFWASNLWGLIRFAPTHHDLQALVEHIRDEMNRRPELHKEMSDRLSEARQRLNKEAKAKPPEKFEHIIIGVDGEPIDGVVFTSPAAWTGTFLAFFDALDQADQQAVLERNTQAITDVSRLDAKLAAQLKRADDVAREDRRPETPAVTPPRGRSMFDEQSHREWTGDKLSEMEQVTEVAVLVSLAKSMKERMDIIKREDPPLWTEVNAKFNSKHEALSKPAT
jgi:hypothetical protein